MFVLPIIAETDFPTLRAILGPAIPVTYTQWTAMLDEIARAHAFEGVARMDVNPEAFADFMTGAGRKLDLQALLDYAAFNPWCDPDLPV